MGAIFHKAYILTDETIWWQVMGIGKMLVNTQVSQVGTNPRNKSGYGIQNGSQLIFRLLQGSLCLFAIADIGLNTNKMGKIPLAIVNGCNAQFVPEQCAILAVVA